MEWGPGGTGIVRAVCEVEDARLRAALVAAGLALDDAATTVEVVRAELAKGRTEAGATVADPAAPERGRDRLPTLADVIPQLV